MRHLALAAALLAASPAVAQLAPPRPQNDPVTQAVGELGAENAMLRVQLASMTQLRDSALFRAAKAEKALADATKAATDAKDPVTAPKPTEPEPGK